MGSKEEIVAAIAETGSKIKAIKDEKAPTMKDDLDPLIKQLLALKVSYKEVTGDDFDPPKPDKKKGPATQESQREGPSKTELNKMAKKAAKEKAKAAERAAKGLPEPTQQAGGGASTETDEALAHLYGDLPLIQSKFMTEKAYKQIYEVDEKRVGQQVWIRGRISSSRAVGKGCFLVVRQGISTVQAVMFQGEKIPKAMVKYATSISLESVVDILADVTSPDAPINSVSLKNVELSMIEIHVVSRATEVPFSVEDAGRNAEYANANTLPVVNQDTALNYRWIDTRTPANQAIFRIQSGVCALFREYFSNKGFVEIHTPKLIGGSSEGGANIFKLKYFDQDACLAQSPQLYKQMTAACGGFDRVFEIGPVFRAEDSNTHRHLCEFTGLDFEMCIYEHYYEALDVMGEMFNFIFDGIYEKFPSELQTISVQYPFEPIKYLRPPLRIDYAEGIALLHQAGITEASVDDDLSTPHEKALGKIVKEKYGTDFYIMDKYPMAARPFYTMPCPENPKFSNSYDLFIRGEEIVSGAQRVHDYDLLYKQAVDKGIDPETIKGYLNSFKSGSLPHAGGGIGLERVVMLYLDLHNIRKTSMFPRDPKRLAP